MTIKWVDFHEEFSPVVKITTLQTLSALAAAPRLEIYQMDVTTAFLHTDTEEKLYIKQPSGLAILHKEHLVCKLKRSLYVLKQVIGYYM